MTWDECRKIRRKTGIVFIFLLSLNRVASLSIDSSGKKDAVVLLAKTKQTFKLGDLQYLEATVQSESNYDCKRLLMDAATGSSLFVLDRLAADFENYILGKENDNSRYQNGLPTSLLSCEWVGEILFESPSPQELLNDLSTKTKSHHLEAWTLEYLRMTSALTSKPQNERPYSQKTLCCCVSQRLPGMAALNPYQAVDKLLLVDTSESVFLVKLLQLPSDEASSVSSPSPARLTPQKWAQRPFPYSAATNFQAAKMVINLLAHRAALCSEQKPHLLDATCGSGTFLALAMAQGMHVTGWDSNPRCVEGTERNLDYAFGSVESFTVLHRNCLDVPEDMTQAGVTKIDAVACNLPWGLNTNIYADDGDSDNCSSRLLSAIRNVLKPGIPCAFLYKDENESAQDDLYWEQLGYKVIGHANIPQKNFVLPKEGKKEKKRSENGALTGRCNCIVSLVETI